MKQAASARQPPKWKPFFVGLATIAACIVLIGFGRTFFLPLIRGEFSASAFVYLHGVVFLGWTGLFITQATLIYARRPALHRKFGRLGFSIATAMIVLGSVVTVAATRRDYASDPAGVISFFLGTLMDLGTFAIFVTLALLLVRRGDWHKRLICLAMLAILGPAIGRIPPLRDLAFEVTMLFLAAIAAYDLAIDRRLHLATLVGGLFLILELRLQTPFGDSSIWQHFGRSLLGL